MRLDQLYRESQLLNKQIKMLDEKCLKETDIDKLEHNLDFRSKKMIDLAKKSRFLFKKTFFF